MDRRVLALASWAAVLACGPASDDPVGSEATSTTDGASATTELETAATEVSETDATETHEEPTPVEVVASCRDWVCLDYDPHDFTTCFLERALAGEPGYMRTPLCLEGPTGNYHLLLPGDGTLTIVTDETYGETIYKISHIQLDLERIAAHLEACTNGACQFCDLYDFGPLLDDEAVCPP